MCEQQEGHFSNRAEFTAFFIVYPLCSPPVGAVISALNYKQFQSERPKQSRVFVFWLTDPQMTGLEVEKTNLASRQKKQHVVTLKRHCTNYTCQNQFTSHREKYCGIRSPPGVKPRWKKYWHGGLCALDSVKNNYSEVCNGIFNCHTTKRKAKTINWSLENR